MASASVFHRFRDMKIVFKLTGGFGLILLLFLCVILISDMSGRSTIGAFKHLITSDMAMADHAGNVHALLLECRKNEKDFLLLRRKELQRLLDATIVEIHDELDSMASISRAGGHAEESRVIAEISQTLDLYASAFTNLVASFEKNGLDHNSGLQGLFRDAVHQLEKDMNSHDLTMAYIALLTMRGHEKDYIRTWSSKYKPMMTESMDSFKDALAHTATDKGAMDAISRGFDAYEAGFQRYFSADEKERALIYEDIRSAARDMEDGFRQVFVPDTRSMLLTIRRHEKDYLLRFMPKYVTETHAALDKLVHAFEAAPILDKHKKDVASAVQTYRRLFDDLVAEQNRITSHKEKIADTMAHIEPLVQSLKTGARVSADRRIVHTENTTFSTLGFVLGIAVVALFIGIAFAFLMTRSITRSLNRTVAFAGEIAQGNLSMHLDISGRDEMGRLASSMNSMTGQLKQIIEKIAHDTGQLQHSSDELFGVSNQLTKGSSDLSSQADQVRGSSETIGDLMRRVTGSSGEAASNLNLLAAATEEMTATVGEIAANAEKARAMTEDAVSQVSRAAQRIDGLGQSAKDIDAVTDTIRDISDQTNLLALNATIEAARAGEAGKGFAVVAHEIKELARQTAESTRSIRSKIEGIQGASNQTVQDIGHISSTIRGVADIVAQVASAVEEQSITTREITQNAARSSQGIEDINEDVDQTNQGIEHINEEIKRVRFFSAELEGNSHSVHESAKHLAELVASLNTLVSGFTLTDSQSGTQRSPSRMGESGSLSPSSS